MGTTNSLDEEQTLSANSCVRRAALGAAAAALLAGLATVPLATADPEPTPSPTPASPTASASATPAAADKCNAAGLTGTISSVNSNMSQYLVGHPDVNQALGDIAKMSPFSAQGALKDFFKEHTAAADDIRAMQQPLKDLSDQCGFKVTPGQVLIALEDV
jgi:hemophore-related protein